MTGRSQSEKVVSKGFQPQPWIPEKRKSQKTLVISENSSDLAVPLVAEELTEELLDLLDALPENDSLTQIFGPAIRQGVVIDQESIQDEHVRTAVSQVHVAKAQEMMGVLEKAVTGLPALFAHGSAFCAHCVSTLGSVGSGGIGAGAGSLAGVGGHFHSDGSWHNESHSGASESGGFSFFDFLAEESSKKAALVSPAHLGKNFDWRWLPQWRPTSMLGSLEELWIPQRATLSLDAAIGSFLGVR